MAPLLRTLVVLTVSLECIHAARILGMFPMWAKSHHNFLRPVMKALAAAGHEVVNYTPFPLDKPPPNYTDIFLENIKPDCKELADYFIEITDFPEWKCVDLYWPLHLLTYPWFIEDPKVQELLTGKDKFDLIFIEGTTVHEHTLVMGRIFNAPIISLQTFALNNFPNSHAGNDYQLSYIPDTCLSLSDRMSFQDRLINTLTSLRGLYHYNNSQLRSLEAMMKKAFPDLPPIAEMARNISLHFVNDHVTADYAQPRPPNVIGVGGIHIEPNKPLPNEIKKFMDEAPAGVIFFSLGTYVNDDIKPKEYFDMYINVFKRFKERVIWKTRKGDIEGLPPNVLTLKWAPQPDILAHPNCVLFITHGGQFSTLEAVHFGVPVIGIPQFFDQHRNVRFFVEREVGVKVAIYNISEKTMSTAIREVLDNPRYRDNMKRLSAVFRDRPMSPVESVVFWTEYVLRHGRAPHLRPASTELRWYQLWLLDVALCVLLVPTFLITFFVLCYKKVNTKKCL